jgi:hypothetical protein
MEFVDIALYNCPECHKAVTLNPKAPAESTPKDYIPLIVFLFLFFAAFVVANVLINGW